jgi:hypothetical protein
MVNLAKIIEADDLNNFELHFQPKNWKDSVASIENYAGISEYIKEITYNDADCFKYALHCNADKIFNYLLPFVDTNKHGENYGWPLLAMAIKNERYDYARAIINHRSFNPYPIYHTNAFLYIESRPNVEEHIEFLFDYLKKFNGYDLQDESLLYCFTHLICHNEETYNRFEEFYRQKTNNPTASLLEVYENKMELLGKEIFDRKYNKFLIEKLSSENVKEIIKSADGIYFSQLFKSPHTKEALTYLLKPPGVFTDYLNKNNLLLSRLPLDCILLLINEGVDIWKENESNVNALDFILKDKNLHLETVQYFIDQYPREILERLESKGRSKGIQTYCQQKLLDDELPIQSKKNFYSKI